MEQSTLINDAIAYWERKRLVYNGVLACVVFCCWGGEILTAKPHECLGLAFVLLFFAAIANVLFCLAYPIDIVLQFSPLRAKWKRCRWVLFASGLMIAGTLAVWVMLRDGMA